MNRIALSLSLLSAVAYCADKPPATPPVLPEVSKAPTIAAPRSISANERSVITMELCQLQDAILVLPAGELVRSSYVADGVNWVIHTAGGNVSSRYLDVKVQSPLTRETTLNLVTDHDHTYTLRLVVVNNHCDSKVFIEPDEELARSIANTRPWASPEEVDQLKAQLDQAKQAKTAETAKADTKVEAFRSTYPSKLRFEYKYDPKVAAKMGIREIFDDGKFTYVSANPQEPPALFELKEGKPSLIQFKFQDGLYSTARVIDAGYLAVGGSGNGRHQAKLGFKRIAGEEN